jgi:undecaprenyl diphosphate synthase
MSAARTTEALHVAVIMDGNGRWAIARGLPRVEGHRRGARAVEVLVRAALATGGAIGTVTMYAFSSDNWQRPAAEVGALMALFDEFLREQAARCAQDGVRVSMVGRRDRLPGSLVEAIARLEAATAACARLHLRLAVDYSAREAIWQAAREVFSGGEASRARLEAAIASGRGVPAHVGPVDLLIRTGGEQRLSDFLLWECAYAELWFTQTMWPDFGRADLQAALAAFRSRQRRFGGLSSDVPVQQEASDACRGCAAPVTE